MASVESVYVQVVHCSLPPIATKHLQADALARRDVWKDSWKQAPWHDGEWKCCFFLPLCSWLMAWADCSSNTSSSSLSFIIHHQSPQSYPISPNIILTIHLHQSTIRDSCQPRRPWWNQVPSGRARPRPLHRKYPGRSPRWKCLWIYRPWPAGIEKTCQREKRYKNREWKMHEQLWLFLIVSVSADCFQSSNARTKTSLEILFTWILRITKNCSESEIKIKSNLEMSPLQTRTFPSKYKVRLT